MSASPSTPLALAGSLLLAAVVPGVAFFVDSRPFREIAGGGVHLSVYALTLAGMLALLVAVPRLGGLASVDGRRLPAPLVTAALLTTALTAATHFVQLVVTPFLADVAPAALDEQNGGVLMISMVGAWTAFLVTWSMIGVVALRRKVLPRSSAGLLVVGALALPAFGPLAGLPLGAGLLLAARATREPVAAPVAVLPAA